MAPPDLPDSRGVGAGLDLQRGDSTSALDQNSGSLPRAGTVKTEND